MGSGGDGVTCGIRPLLDGKQAGALFSAMARCDCDGHACLEPTQLKGCAAEWTSACWLGGGESESTDGEPRVTARIAQCRLPGIWERSAACSCPGVDSGLFLRSSRTVDGFPHHPTEHGHEDSGEVSKGGWCPSNSSWLLEGPTGGSDLPNRCLDSKSREINSDPSTFRTWQHVKTGPLRGLRDCVNWTLCLGGVCVPPHPRVGIRDAPVSFW